MIELTKKETEIYQTGKKLQSKIGTQIFSSQLYEVMGISRSNFHQYMEALISKNKVKFIKKGTASKRIEFL